mmetsp:Transcript_55683/g.132772  ORF Transcript_55683/g.132772 Transcript_55683/m.132772 type:complete len:342 (-) Transcript_55683:182-1207(-)|eukprot:CAMPEP_0178407386 /NCGR_PEP_ID=MMETSP0689_2-20121128/19404_1 /TAXON_ID=160604 /ORGANISM="Amphidinium massartii, Strain CS-259" /LENGTH=341 /DNA_ID=CAMNT_0020028463 /DNA_START=55 /DNA_END=1080 /DNA_ORIENTATION=-
MAAKTSFVVCALLAAFVEGLRPKDAYAEEVDRQQAHHQAAAAAQLHAHMASNFTGHAFGSSLLASGSKEPRVVKAFDPEMCQAKLVELLSEKFMSSSLWLKFVQSTERLAAEASWSFLRQVGFGKWRVAHSGLWSMLHTEVEKIKKAISAIRGILGQAQKAAKGEDFAKSGDKLANLIKYQISPVYLYASTEVWKESGQLTRPMFWIPPNAQELATIAYERERFTKHFTWATNYDKQEDQSVPETPKKFLDKLLDAVRDFQERWLDFIDLCEYCSPEDHWIRKSTSYNNLKRVVQWMEQYIYGVAQDPVYPPCPNCGDEAIEFPAEVDAPADGDFPEPAPP